MKLFLFILCICLSMQQDDISVTPNSFVVNTPTIYTVQIMLITGYTYPAGTRIQFIFPSQYSSLLTNGNRNCAIKDANWQDPTVSSLTCNLNNLVLTIAGGFPNLFNDGFAILSFTVDNIKNPLSTLTTSPFIVRFYSSSNSLINQIITNSGVTFTPGSLTCFLTPLGSTTVNTISKLRLSITPSTPIPTNGKIQITTPQWWPSDVQNASTSTIVNMTLSSCENISNTANGMSCSVAFVYASTNIYVITIESLFLGVTSTNFIFSVGPFRNPQSTKVQGSFTVSSLTNNNTIIDQCIGATFSGATPASITNLVFSMSSNTVNSAGSATFKFNIINPLKPTDTITMTFPNDFTLGTVAVTNFGSSLTTSKSSNTVSVTSIGSSLSSGTAQFNLVVTGVTNPPSTKTATGFKVTIFRDTGITEQSTNSINYQATVGALLATLTPSNSQSSSLSTYAFSITLANSITSSSVLFITFPSEFASILATGIFTCTSNRSSSPSCSYVSGTRIMTVSSYTSSSAASGDVILVSIQGITNPAMIGIFSSLILTTTYSSTTDTVDTVTSNVYFTLTPRTLTKDNVVLTSSNSTVYALSNLNFVITNLNPIQANSNIFIGYPSEVTPTTATCQVNSNGKLCTLSVYNGYNGFYISSAVATGLPSGGLATYPVSLMGVYMPTSMKQSSSFQIYIIYPDGSVSEFLTTGLTISATAPCLFSTFSISSSNNINFATTVYNIQFTPMFMIPNNSILRISLPTSMATTTSCTAGTGINTVSCTNLTSYISAVLGFSSVQTGPTSMAISLNNLKTFSSLASYQITITLLDPTGTYQSSQQSYSLTNLNPNVISINSASFSSTIMGEATTLNFKITPSITIPVSGYILLTFPNQFTLGSISCSLPTGLSCSKNGQMVNIASSVSPTFPVEGTISGIIAPSITPSPVIYVQTYGSDGYLMTRDNSINFAISCNLYCRTCTSNPSQCTSCYSNPIASGNTIKSGTTCISTCPKGKYQLSGSCIDCPENCTACVSGTECTECTLTTYLYNKQCLVNCPGGFYPSVAPRTCVSCTSALHCQTCLDAFSCTSCLNPYFNYQNVCLSNCPSGITVENTVLYSCDPCPANCSQCSGYPITICTVCKPGYLLDNNRCALTCITNGYVPWGLICKGCSTICLTCSVNPNNCTSCDNSGTNPYFFNNNCLSTCTGGYYNDNNAWTCRSCNPPCETCTSASINSCLSCISPLYLYQTSCETSCPDKFYINGRKCSPCLDPCLTCTAGTICLSCNSTLFLYKQDCVAACPFGMIVDPPNICKNCTLNCKTCVGADNQCQTCYQTFYLNGGVCVTQCPQNYYISPTNTCVICKSPCQTCSSDTVCITCVDGYNLDGSQCKTTCSGNKIPVNKVCTSCDPACTVCQGTISNCSACATGYVYTDALHRCSSSCPAGYVLYAANSSCLIMCPVRFYNHSNACAPCPSNCLSCSSANDCTQCDTGLVLYNGLCYSNCPPAAPYNIDNKCLSCNIANCQTCSNSLCSSCKSGYLLIKYQQCIQNCPTGQTYNASLLQCTTPATVINDTTTGTSNSVPLTFAPAPVGIGAVAAFLTVIIVRAQHPQMSLLNSYLPILSVLTITSAIINGIVYYFQKKQLDMTILLKLAGVGLYLLLNFTNSIMECIYLKMDKNFQKVLKHNKSVLVILILSVLLTFKWFVFLSSSFCNIRFLKVKLSKDGYISALKILFLTSIISLGCFIASSVLYILTLNNYMTFLFFGAVELITLSVIQILMTFMSMSTLSKMVGKIKEKQYQNSQIQSQLPDDILSKQEGSFQKIFIDEDHDKPGDKSDINEQSKSDNQQNSVHRQKQNLKKVGSTRKQGKNRQQLQLKSKQNEVKMKQESYQQLISEGQLMSHQEGMNKQGNQPQRSVQQSLVFFDQKENNNELLKKDLKQENNKLSQQDKLKTSKQNPRNEDDSNNTGGKPTQEKRDNQLILQNKPQDASGENENKNDSKDKNSKQQNSKGENNSKILASSQLKEGRQQNESDKTNQINPQNKKPSLVEPNPSQVIEKDQKLIQQNQQQDINKLQIQRLKTLQKHEQNTINNQNNKKSIQDTNLKDNNKKDKSNNNQQQQIQKNKGTQEDNQFNNNSNTIHNQDGVEYSSYGQEGNLRRTDSCEFQKEKPNTPNSEHEIRSAFNRPNDVIKVPNKLIPQALEKGLFNHDLNSILQNQRKEDEESALDEAPKMNAMENMKRYPINQEQFAANLLKDIDKKTPQQGKKQISKTKKQQQDTIKKKTQNEENIFFEADQQQLGEQNIEQQNLDQEKKQQTQQEQPKLKGKEQEKENQQLRQSKKLKTQESHRIKTQQSMKKSSNAKNLQKVEDLNNDLKNSKLTEEEKSKKDPNSNKTEQSPASKQKKINTWTTNNPYPQVDPNLKKSQNNTHEQQKLTQAKQLDNSPNEQTISKTKNNIKSQQSNDQPKRKQTNTLDPIAQESDLAATMERKKIQQPEDILDFKFQDDDELEDDYQTRVAAKLRTVEPKKNRKKSKESGSDDLESIATVEQVDIKLPQMGKQKMRTLDTKPEKDDNRYLSIEDEDLQRPSQYFRQPRSRPIRPQVISVSSFGSLNSKQTSKRLNNIGRMSLDNSFQKPPRQKKK